MIVSELEIGEWRRTSATHDEDRSWRHAAAAAALIDCPCRGWPCESMQSVSQGAFSRLASCHVVKIAEFNLNEE
jgi:hypothetical protein